MPDIQVPQNDIFDKLGDCTITLWILVGGRNNSYRGTFTEEERTEHMDTKEWENSDDYWQRVEFTIKELFNAQKAKIEE